MLVKKRTPHNVDRPLVHHVIGYIVGIIGGNILRQKMYVSFSIWLCILISGIMIYLFYYTRASMIKWTCCSLLGFLCFINNSVYYEEQLFKIGETYIVTGKVSEVTQSQYYKWITLTHVKLCEEEKSLKSNVRVRMPLSFDNISLYDTLTVEAEVLETTPCMNPSDFDYNAYLKSETIVATLKAKEPITYTNLENGQVFYDYMEHTPFLERIQIKLHNQLEQLFTDDEGYINDKIGIIEACLLGDDSKLNHQTKSLYQQAGISHVLCISGFHVGVILSVMISSIIFVSRFCFIPYTLRQILLILAIWGYALLTGGAVSTIRATQMVTIALIGKCLWQEDDALTNLALATFIILFLNPYQLFRVGFQLSFGAVLGIILCEMEIEKRKIETMQVYTKLQRTIRVWLSVQLFTFPILIYHFYSAPFTLSILNLVVVPLFAVLIIVSWGLVGLSFLTLPIAKIGMESIIDILNLIESVIAKLEEQLPLATVCLGKPNFFNYSLFIGLIIVIYSVLWGYLKLKQLYPILTIIGCLYLSMTLYKDFNPEQLLKVTSLYVGQGDCTVIEMPKHGLFIVDGGDFGKGSTLKNYIQYLGYNSVEGVMISHCDSDHVGGILELLDTTIKIKHIFLAEDKENENFNTLINQCQEKKIAVHYLDKGDTITYGEVFIECFAPDSQKSYATINDKSLLCKLSYRDFTMLFTGDKSIDSDKTVYQTINPVTLLKVSHHGSNTGTSQALLAQIQPHYATISCGINNSYHHPHQEVITLLESYAIDYNRTDKDGAIFYKTDGYYLSKTQFRKEC